LLRLPLQFFSAVVLASTLSLSLPSPSLSQSSNAPNAAPVPLERLENNSAKSDEYHEDFSSLTLLSSAFFPSRPVLGQTDDYPQNSFIRERWLLFWRPSDPIDLYICKPRGVSKPPVILYLYGYPTDTERFKSDSWCSTTTAGGFAAIGFLSANTGARLDYHPHGTTFFSDLQQSLGASVHDVQLVLNYLATRNDLDMSRIGIFGEGTGGSVAILASVADPRIKALDVMTPWGDWPEFFATSPAVSKEKRAKFTSQEYLSTVANLDPLKWLPEVQAKNLRMQDVRGGGPMTPGLLDAVEAAAPERATINQFGDSAAFMSHNPSGALPAWLQEQLRPGSNPLVAKDKTQRIHTYPAEAEKNPLPPIPMPAPKS
jgi:hypothetical protein